MNNQHAQEMLELIIEGLDSLTDSHRLRVEQEIVAGAGCIPAYGLPCHHDSAVASGRRYRTDCGKEGLNPPLVRGYHPAHGYITVGWISV